MIMDSRKEDSTGPAPGYYGSCTVSPSDVRWELLLAFGFCVLYRFLCGSLWYLARRRWSSVLARGRYMYMYMYMYMFVYMCMHMYMYMHVYMYVCVCTCVCMPMCVWYMYMIMYMYMFMYMCSACMHVCVCICRVGGVGGGAAAASAAASAAGIVEVSVGSEAVKSCKSHSQVTQGAVSQVM